ncbi:MAG: phospholipase D-like domain-containing protein, partial [Myxococcota bacterium]
MGQPRRSTTARLTLLAALTLAACSGATPGDDPLDDEHAGFADGKADGIVAGSDEAAAVLLLVNDPAVDFEELDDDARLHKTAAANIIEHRNGEDGLVSTADDDRFDDLDELDKVSFVGPTALLRLRDYAVAQGYLEQVLGGGDRNIDVIFSPQPIETSHNARVADLIDGAQHSIDIMMYSFSDAAISDALEAAVERGVTVRFVFETANKDRKLDGDDLANSKSGRLEQMGVDVRWVNKIMHHKLMIVDGPRDEASRAGTAEIVSGSANWSFGGATRYDENTLFMSGYPEMALRLQAEFDHLWAHSRTLDVGDGIEFEESTLDIDEQTLSLADEENTHIYFTSDNFDVSGDTFKKTGRNTVSDQLVDAIEGATDSILVASGHLRLRPVSEALIAKAEANPDMDIRVYLDAQEYVSATTHNIQVEKLEDCIDNATTQSKINSCMDKGFRFGFLVGESGADVRYKWYAQRWHFSYAE